MSTVKTANRKITPYKGGRSARVYARITPEAKVALFARVESEGFRSFADWLEAQAMPHLTMRPADGAESLEPQWICMTCKTVIGPVVDDGKNRCKCKDAYLIDLWRVAPIVETPRRLR